MPQLDLSSAQAIRIANQDASEIRIANQTVWSATPPVPMYSIFGGVAPNETKYNRTSSTWSIQGTYFFSLEQTYRVLGVRAYAFTSGWGKVEARYLAGNLETNPEGPDWTLGDGLYSSLTSKPVTAVGFMDILFPTPIDMEPYPNYIGLGTRVLDSSGVPAGRYMSGMAYNLGYGDTQAVGGQDLYMAGLSFGDTLGRGWTQSGDSWPNSSPLTSQVWLGHDVLVEDVSGN